MAVPYSVDLRTRVLANFKGNKSLKKICKIFKIHPRTVYAWAKLKETRGTLEPKTGYQKGWGRKMTDLKSFKKAVDSNPDKPQIFFAKMFGVTQKTISNTMIKIGYTRKKKL